MKNLFSILICCFLIIVFISCSKTPPDTPQLPPVNTDSSTFLIQLASSYPESGAGVMFHDINGKLLRYAAYNGSDTILFSTRDSLPGNKINITFFTPFDNGPNGKEYDLVSFLYNDMGQKWIVNDTNDNSGYMQTGTFQVNLFGINTDGQYNASDKEGYVFNDDNYHYETHTLNSTTTLVGNNTDYLVHYWDPGVQPGYIFLHNVRANSVYNLDIKDLKPYDHNLTIHFPKTQGIQYSVNNVTSPDNPNRGFILNGSFGSGAGNFDSAVSQLTLGYLDTFAVYHTFLSTSYDSVV